MRKTSLNAVNESAIRRFRASIRRSISPDLAELKGAGKIPPHLPSSWSYCSIQVSNDGKGEDMTDEIREDEVEVEGHGMLQGDVDGDVDAHDEPDDSDDVEAHGFRLGDVDGDVDGDID